MGDAPRVGCSGRVTIRGDGVAYKCQNRGVLQVLGQWYCRSCVPSQFGEDAPAPGPRPPGQLAAATANARRLRDYHTLLAYLQQAHGPVLGVTLGQDFEELVERILNDERNSR